jgi:hypothetical protein
MRVNRHFLYSSFITYHFFIRFPHPFDKQAKSVKKEATQMSPKKKRQLILLNATIVAVNIALFSRALIGLSLFSGSAFSISLAWTAIVLSVLAFFKGNSQILNKAETHLLLHNVNSLDNCIAVFEEAIHNGDVFDDSILKNIEQIKRFKRKRDTIKDILLQKFSTSELSFQKFISVLTEIENVIYLNMRSILNKISAFDVQEYENMQKKGFYGSEFSQEKLDIYNEYINFVNNATKTNEEILLKMDRMLLEISRYNSLEDGDVQKLPAIVEMDQLIKNANLYK